MKKIYLFILCAILSFSADGQINWSKHSGNPVFQPIAGGWEAYLGYIGSVIFHDNLYHMWYNASSTASTYENVGYATSPDGITWTRDVNNPVFGKGSTGSWDQDYASCGAVALVNDTMHMWYTGHNGDWSNSGIGHATSTDGVNWTRDANNPVLTIKQEGDWDYEWIWIDEVVHDGTNYHIWYWAGNLTGESGGGIGHATSINGSAWTRDASNPVFKPGTPEDWDYPAVADPGVVYDGTLFHMWYAGGDYSVIGYAYSADGTHWTKFDGNPVLRKGSKDSWDSRSIYNPSVVDSAGIKYKLWYIGRARVGPRGYGYAESDTRVPYLMVVDSKPLYDSTDTVVAKIALDGTIYIVPDGTSLVVDSIIKYMVASAAAIANTEVELPLTDLPIGNYLILGVSSTGFISTDPYLLNVVDNADRPDLTLRNDTVIIGYPIYATSTKKGTIFLVKEGISEVFIKNPLYLIDSSVVAQANDTVEFSTNGLNPRNYWLYAVDMHGLFSEPDSITIGELTGIEESTMAGISIYPNPANTLIFIETGKARQYSIELHSITGQLLYTSRMEGPRLQIDLSSFRKGVYFITIRSEDFTGTRKIIKLYH